MQLTPGTRLGPYEILGAIGAGGMGEVYRARDTKLDRTVAIKVLPETFAADPDRLARFEREAKTLAALNHPHIAQIYGLAEGDNALAMEFVEGEDLSQRIARGAMPLEEAIPVARQIAEALEAAHDHGIVHRDLKPANIKVTTEGSVKVLDFGLAKASVATADITNSPTFTMQATHAGVILGTAAYMSPEQARGIPVDRRADIWAFGAVLLEMLTGRPMFEGTTVSDLIASVIKERVPLEQLPPTVPSAIRALIVRCLEKDPKQRLRDIGEARIVLSSPALPSGAETPERAASGRTNRALLVATVLLALSLVAALGLLWFRSPQSSRGIVRFDFAAPGDLALTVRPSVSISPDGSTVAFAASSEGGSRLYVRRRDATEARELSGTQGASNPAFSPDGAWLAFVSGKQLMKVSLDGQSVPLATVNDPRGLSWIDMASIVYVPEAASGLIRLSADGGEPTRLTTPDVQKGERTHRWPSALPGGKAVLFTVGTVGSPDDYDESDVEAVIVATGERRPILKRASMASYSPSGHLLFARGGTLHAARFDPDALQVIGSTVPVIQGVMGDRTTGAAHFAIASDGTLAYIPGTSIGGTHAITWVDSTGTASPIDLPRVIYNDIAISPDGTRAAFIQGASGMNGDVWVYDFQRKSNTRFTFDSKSATPVWSDDGKWIYYSSIETGGTKSTFLRKPADGTKEEEPVGSLKGRGYLKHALDGGTSGIVETTQSGAERNIHRVRLTPGKADVLTLEPVVAGRPDEYGADVSPDGRWLAYTSDETGRTEVYVRGLTSGGGRWQISTQGGEEPHWSPDGRRLYYRFEDGLYTAAIETQGGFAATSNQLMFRGAYNLRSDTGISYDVDRKTGRLLMIRATGDQKTRTNIRVVLGWFEELKSKFPR